MKVLSGQALVALLLAIGIEQALALPTADALADVSVTESDLLYPESSYDDVLRRALEPVVIEGDTIYITEEDLNKLDGAEEEVSQGLAARATPGDDQANPIEKAFPASETNYDGLQELFDADCFAHLCKEAPVTINWWNQASRNRGVANGNGVSSRAIFKKDHVKFGTKSPDNFNKYVSPEEWPPASSAQGGRPAILFPVTVAAQDRQKTLLSAYYIKKPSVGQQKGVTGSSKGTWVRITAFDGAQGPYCKILNDLLKNFNSNFNNDGTLQAGRKPSNCTQPLISLTGVKYDMGKYAYEINAKHDNYTFIGKN